ncbi:hypothetical protein DICPUDRAFT_92898 [Dictyostelium purpureum]|uniref:Glutaredoxin domain-containing protein n=1 Tax=Dictyostelium purpureum TaxID=5786 RepID=F0ZZ08_DICPU|nr:uncharacterized protein DICPUDRAFT_92898 [Dictyostelium purpureum]EGC30816.1 hypothetical protein DICPUDRAFT_92898 [Dictyostelium purpureum]|eukprot:XP_003292659.1 hypothetical protein DICPUDRAFT_92898 [Dictyostelium purpureum]
MDKVVNLIKSHKLIIFSKTFCPYCVSVKSLFEQIGVKPFVVELDRESDGAEMQANLAKHSGMRTVPQVFINEKLIGGCDDTTKLHKSGKLVQLLKEAGLL